MAKSNLEIHSVDPHIRLREVLPGLLTLALRHTYHSVSEFSLPTRRAGDFPLSHPAQDRRRWDGRFGRRVALKFLPDESAGDAQALSRSQREAKAAFSQTTAEAIGQMYSKSGYKAALRTWVEHLTTPANLEYVAPGMVASIYARLGENGHAFEWLEKAYQERDSDLVFLKG